ncbi:hypothetical protein HAX54_023236, partial [Datura stramonium]|nr:hypothetical protein [Datura stramonium]
SYFAPVTCGRWKYFTCWVFIKVLTDSRAMQTPFRSYLQEMLALVKRENAGQ